MCALHFKKQFQKAAALIILLLFASAYIQAQHGVGSEGPGPPLPPLQDRPG